MFEEYNFYEIRQQLASGILVKILTYLVFIKICKIGTESLTPKKNAISLNLKWHFLLWDTPK